ncbi:MAG: carboxypeptidase-like regulatory domain-containing protein [archaeon]
MKKIILYLFLIVAFSFCVQGAYFSVNKINYQYFPTFTIDVIDNTTKTGCITGDCTGCTDMYKMDCAFYYVDAWQGCGSLYSNIRDYETCADMVFHVKIKNPKQITSFCDERKEYRDFCIQGLALEYGGEKDSELCSEIDRDDIVDTCYGSYAVKLKDPELCKNVKTGTDLMINCCLDAKYNYPDYYITTRQDLIDSYTEKHGPEFEECRKIALVTPFSVVEKCEDLNCDCLDPCNKIKNDNAKQIKCAQDCGVEYQKCYAKERTEMIEEKRNMYYYQIMNGGFSRKHCKGHSFMPDSVGDEAQMTIQGTIKDRNNKPLPYMLIKINSSTGTNAQGFTDKDGKYSINAAGLKLKKDTDYVEATITLVFSYQRDGKNYFNLIWNSIEEYSQPFRIGDKGDTEVNIILDNSIPADYSSNNGLNQFTEQSFGVIYYRMHEAVEFSLVKLKANIDYKLPVDVVIGNGDQKTLYSPGTSTILIAAAHAAYNHGYTPKNREYHEFAHHLMYTNYGSWTDGSNAPGVVNHDGYINPNSGDSFEEGFAEFMALVMSDYFKDPNPWEYSVFGTMEKNYVPWDNTGYDEEFAVASFLWDLYDKANDKGDTLTIPLDEIWDVIKVKRKDFFAYYDAFVNKYPDKKKELEAIAIEHGFYHETSFGNGQYDANEPFRDTTNNGYNAGELYVDFPGNGTLNFSYEKNEIIGKPANYNRENRSLAVIIPNAFLKVPDESVVNYIVKVKFRNSADGPDYQYMTQNIGGYIYVHPVPERFDAEIEIVPKSDAFKANAPAYKITNANLHQKILSAKNGYFASYNFDLTPTGKTPDEKVLGLDGKPASFLANDDNDLDVSAYIRNVEYPKLELQQQKKKASNLPMIIAALVIVATIALFAFALKQKKNDGSNRKDKEEIKKEDKISEEENKKAHHEKKKE